MVRPMPWLAMRWYSMAGMMATSAAPLGALRGDGEGEVVFVAQGTVCEAADERGGVEILHDGNAESGHGWWRENRKRKYSRHDFAARNPVLL